MMLGVGAARLPGAATRAVGTSGWKLSMSQGASTTSMGTAFFEFFCGWDSNVELNYGKHTPWDKKYPFSDSHPYYGMSSTDQTRHVSEAASSSDWPLVD